MKKILYLAATVLLCASCFHVNRNFGGGVHINGKNSIKGEGPLVTRSFDDLKDFDAIRINGQADVLFTQSDEFKVTLHTQENIFDHVDYRVEGSTLIIELKDKKTAQAEAYDLVIKAPALKDLEVNGASDFYIPAGLVSEDNFKVQVNGAGDLRFDGIRCRDLSIEANGACDVEMSDIDVQKLKIQVNGAGDVDVTGNAAEASLEVNGAGDIDATGLKVAGEVSKHTAGLAKIKI